MVTLLLLFWQALPIKAFLPSIKPRTVNIRQYSSFENLYSNVFPLQHALLESYELLLNLNVDFILYFLSKWESELGLTLLYEQRDHVIFFAHKSNITNRFLEVGYVVDQVVQGTHNLKKKCSPLYHSCVRGSPQERGTLFHIFCQCLLICCFGKKCRRWCLSF